jgi:glutamate--cysteine ligase
MARDTTDLTPIESRDVLVEWLEAGCKPRDRWRIGTEHEKFGFYTRNNAPVPYEGELGIGALLERMRAAIGWEAIKDGERIIGLAEPNGQGAISLEPGGQFELSGAAVATLHETCAESNEHLAIVKSVAGEMGIAFIGLGASPLWTLEQTPRMPKSRYAIMERYMPKVGRYGLDMMYRTATIQTNLDFASEADMRRKLQLSLKLQPVASALFARSPFTDGKPNGYLSWRCELWRDTDNQRAGYHPFMLSPSFGFEAYVDWALSVPMYFVIRDGRYHDCTHVTFRQFMEGALAGEVPDGRATLGDWSNHLTTLFPDVRLKRYLEMRGADGGPWRDICALSALWVGMLYDDDAMAEGEELVAGWSAGMVGEMRDAVPRLALNAAIGGRAVRDIASRFVSISASGLARRGNLSGEGRDETVYLEPLRETLAAGLTPAERLLKRYDTTWNGDLDRLFAEYSY